MKKIIAVTIGCFSIIVSLHALGYSETGTETKEEDFSLAKEIQAELPGVFNTDSAFLATGFNFVANTPSLLEGVGIVSSNDLALNQFSSPPVSGGGGSGGPGIRPKVWPSPVSARAIESVSPRAQPAQVSETAD